jgi:hypothetical protein
LTNTRRALTFLFCVFGLMRVAQEETKKAALAELKKKQADEAKKREQGYRGAVAAAAMSSESSDVTYESCIGSGLESYSRPYPAAAAAAACASVMAVSASAAPVLKSFDGHTVGMASLDASEGPRPGAAGAAEGSAAGMKSKGGDAKSQGDAGKTGQTAKVGGGGAGGQMGAGAVAMMDLTTIPSNLDRQFHALDVDAAVRPTTITVKKAMWHLDRRTSLVSRQSERTRMRDQEKKKAHTTAFTLLDALTKSGALVLEQATLHVIIAATHCFDKTLMDTVVKRNVNPIEKVERSSLIVASTIHGEAPANVAAVGQLPRLAMYAPSVVSTSEANEIAAAAARPSGAPMQTLPAPERPVASARPDLSASAAPAHTTAERTA